MSTKDNFRTHALNLRKQHAGAPLPSFLTTVSQLPIFSTASAVALYLRCGVEPPTNDIIDHCHARGQHVGVPAWIPQTRVYAFCSLLHGEPLAPGHKHIKEPIDKRLTDTAIYDLFLIPGLIFDTHGTRIGHGKGYYDRLLAKRQSSAIVAALIFDWQISTEPLPRESHDVLMDFIITPTRIIPCVTD